MNARWTTGAVVAAAALITVAAPMATANAYAGSCSGPIGAGNLLQVREFSMQDAGDSTLVTVEADAALSASDAQLFLDRGTQADFFLFGDDEGSDDLLGQFKPDRYYVSPSGYGMRGAFQVPNATLDEDGLHGFPPRPDPEHFADKSDEFYVDIRMGDPRGGAHRIESCRLSLTVG